MSDDDDNNNIVMTPNRPYLLRAIYDWISDNDLTPYVLVDATFEGVSVPPQAVRNGQVVLNLTMQAVVNLDLGNDRVSFSARFSGVSQSVNFPIAAVQAIYAQENGQGMMFAEQDGGDEPPPPQIPPPDSSPTEPEADKSRKRGAPHLKVVK